MLLERDYIHLHDNFKTVIPGNLCLKGSPASSEEPYEFTFELTFYEAEGSSEAALCNSICEALCGGNVVPLLIYCTD